MAIVRYTLDPKNPPKLSAENRARLDAMTEAEIEANALSDPDNPPFTDEELDRMSTVRLVREARAAPGLSQVKFAKAFGFTVGRLRDLEQGRFKRTDTALMAYLTVIAREPEAVLRALEAA